MASEQGARIPQRGESAQAEALGLTIHQRCPALAPNQILLHLWASLSTSWLNSGDVKTCLACMQSVKEDD